MRSFVVLGSCLSSIVAAYLKAEYNWEMLANSSVLRSDHFLDCVISHNKYLPPKANIVEDIVWKDGMGTDGLRLLDEVYPETTGRIDMPADAPGLLEVLQKESVDLFLLDNLHDLSHVLTHYRAGLDEKPYSLPFSLSRCENETALISSYYYGELLTADDSVENWLNIIRYIQLRQPQARIIFLCAHGAGSEDIPQRYAAAMNFSERFPARASALGVEVLPPVKVDAQLLLDRDHFVASLYRAMAGHIVVATEGGWSAPVGQHDRPASEMSHEAVLPTPTRPTPIMLSGGVR